MTRVLLAGATGYLGGYVAKELAFRALEKPARSRAVPVWVMRLVTARLKPFDRHRGELLAFFTMAMGTDVTAPRTGDHALGHYVTELTRDSSTGGSGA